MGGNTSYMYPMSGTSCLTICPNHLTQCSNIYILVTTDEDQVIWLKALVSFHLPNLALLALHQNSTYFCFKLFVKNGWTTDTASLTSLFVLLLAH